MSNFETLSQIDVSDKVDKKNGLSYLSWAWAWSEFRKFYPDASYQIKLNADNLPIFGNSEVGYMVYTSIATSSGEQYEMWLPVMDNRNKAILQPTMTDINKSLMRCLTKNIAMFGLGLYIYAGEDLPEAPEEKPTPLTKDDITAYGFTEEQTVQLIEFAEKKFNTALKDFNKEQINAFLDLVEKKAKQIKENK